MAFRGEDITEDEIKKLEPIVGDEGFTVDNMKSKSAAAANLCSWVISIYTYNRIYVKVNGTLVTSTLVGGVNVLQSVIVAPPSLPLNHFLLRLSPITLQHPFLWIYVKRTPARYIMLSKTCKL